MAQAKKVKRQRAVAIPGTPGARLVEAMTERGWNQSELAENSGVPISVINRFVGNVRVDLRSKTVQGLTSALGISGDWLMKNKGPKRRSGSSAQAQAVVIHPALDAYEWPSGIEVDTVREVTRRVIDAVGASPMPASFVRDLIARTITDVESEDRNDRIALPDADDDA